MERVLIVDDDPDIQRLVSYNLQIAGFDPVTAASGRKALEIIAERPPDLIILDLMLPDVDGNEVCRSVRTMGRTRRIPILMLTARSEEADRVLGFELGADDYVTKPFSPRELVLRVKSLLRRRDEKLAEVQSVGGVRMYPDRRHCIVRGKPVPLTVKEFDLLLELIQANGNVVTREYLLQQVWGYHGDASSRTLDTHVRRLREKLAAEGRRIETVRGVGFRIASR
jgi:DNA-binding response OmpR family regulator